jgi:hypothetical protein
LYGVKENIPVPGGWTQCYADTYNVVLNLQIANIQASCTKQYMMLACRPAGQSNLQVAAMANRSDVMFDTGTDNTPHNANGVG